MLLLFTIEDTFVIKGKGLALTGVAPSPAHPWPRAGRSVQFRTPSGVRVTAVVLGVETFRAAQGELVDRAILIADAPDVAQIPKGSEVWGDVRDE